MFKLCLKALKIYNCISKMIDIYYRKRNLKRC